MEYHGKLSNLEDSLQVFFFFQSQKAKNVEKLRKNLQYGRAWYFCRGPPDCRCS